MANLLSQSRFLFTRCAINSHTLNTLLPRSFSTSSAPFRQRLQVFKQMIASQSKFKPPPEPMENTFVNEEAEDSEAEEEEMERELALDMKTEEDKVGLVMRDIEENGLEYDWDEHLLDKAMDDSDAEKDEPVASAEDVYKAFNFDPLVDAESLTYIQALHARKAAIDVVQQGYNFDQIDTTEKAEKADFALMQSMLKNQVNVLVAHIGDMRMQERQKAEAMSNLIDQKMELIQLHEMAKAKNIDIGLKKTSFEFNRDLATEDYLKIRKNIVEEMRKTYGERDGDDYEFDEEEQLLEKAPSVHVKAPYPNLTLPKLRPRVVDSHGRSYGNGYRKTARARAWIRPGTGVCTVNGRNVALYFTDLLDRQAFLHPFLATGTIGKYDVQSFVSGGGLSGQSGAIQLAISRALALHEPYLRPKLKALGFLTRDRRRVERKKFGRFKARKSYTFVRR